MSAPTARRLVTAGSLSLALALAAPAAAFAGGDDDSGKGGNGGGKPTPTASSTSSPAPTSTQEQRSTGASKGQQDEDSDGKKGSKAPKGDPRGNNGTVKIDDAPFDETPGNEPHVGCLFQIDFFGFDKGDVADITLTGHAPTGGGLLWSRMNAPISDDAAGGGQDVDAAFTVRFADLNLAGATPHPKQGYHVKLAADVESAPGGAKQKVFWIKCAQAPVIAGSTTPTTVTAGTTSTPATGGGGATAVAVDKAPLARTFGEGGVTLNAGARQAGGGKGAGAATVAAQSAARPSALPFTGTEGLGYLLALGLSAVGVGTLAHRLGRRRATTA